MRLGRTLITLVALALLAGCGGVWRVDYEQALPETAEQDWNIVLVVPVVPEELTVSEANSFAPNADIVWHGEPKGNRKEQVARILSEGIRSGVAGLDGSRDVMLVARLRTFHAVTPAAVARAPSAVHNISFDVRLFDARTREPLTETEFISADLEAYVGAAAVLSALNGETQRVRIVDHLTSVMRGWAGQGPDPRRRFGSLGR